MTFNDVNWDNPSIFRKNLVALGCNIFMIKFYYEVDQMEKLHRTDNPSSRDFLLESYITAANEAIVYLKTLNAFLSGNASLPGDKQQLEWVLEYFLVKEEHLLNV